MIENGHGFMGFWSDIDPSYHLSYQEWHNCEHMPERVSIPGFLEGRRYRTTGGGTTYFMCYVTRSPDVLGSPAYLAALNRPTQWTQEALTRFRNPTRMLYARLVTIGRAQPYRPYIALLRFDTGLSSDDLAAVLEASLPVGFVGSLFAAEVEASGIMTAERRIYSGGPGKQQFLIAIEGPEREATRACLAALEDRLGRDLRDAAPGLYWLEARIREEDLAKPPAQGA